MGKNRGIKKWLEVSIMFFICQCTSICYVKLDFTNNNLNENIILEYQTKLSGQLNTDKIEYLENEKLFITQTIVVYILVKNKS